MKMSKKYIIEVQDSLKKLDMKRIETAVKMIMGVYEKNGKIYILGNGGSASLATHMACDLAKGTVVNPKDTNEKRIQAISLSDNTALVTAIANDFSFNNVFSDQLKGVLGKDDLAIVISVSGDSKNLINAVKLTNKVEAKTIGLLGFKNGGLLAELVDCAIVVQSNNYGPVEDVHLIVSHIITSLVVEVKLSRVAGKRKLRNKYIPFR